MNPENFRDWIIPDDFAKGVQSISDDPILIRVGNTNIFMNERPSEFKLCNDCECPIIYHEGVIYKADDPNERDIVMMKCKNCDCHDIFIPKK